MLYLRGADALQNESFFTSNGIFAVLSVGDEAPPSDWAHIKQRLHIKKNDTPDVKLDEHFAEVVAFVHGARIAGRGVYIHCHAVEVEQLLCHIHDGARISVAA